MGTGEKYDALEAFHPDRMASRILGMGDVLSLIESAEKNYDEEKAEKQLQKMKKNQFTLEDFLEQIGQIKDMRAFTSSRLQAITSSSGSTSFRQTARSQQSASRISTTQRAIRYRR